MSNHIELVIQIKNFTSLFKMPLIQVVLIAGDEPSDFHMN